MRPLGTGGHLGSPSTTPAEYSTAVQEAPPQQCGCLGDTQGKGIPTGPCLYSGEKPQLLNLKQNFCPTVAELGKNQSCRTAVREHQKRF